MIKENELLEMITETERREGEVFMYDLIVEGTESQVERAKDMVGNYDTDIEDVRRPSRKTRTRRKVTPYRKGMEFDDMIKIMEVLETLVHFTPGMKSSKIELTMYNDDPSNGDMGIQNIVIQK